MKYFIPICVESEKPRSPEADNAKVSLDINVSNVLDSHPVLNENSLLTFVNRERKKKLLLRSWRLRTTQSY